MDAETKATAVPQRGITAEIKMQIAEAVRRAFKRALSSAQKTPGHPLEGIEGLIEDRGPGFSRVGSRTHYRADSRTHYDDYDIDAELDVPLEVPKDPAHGDFATNIAMVLASRAKKNPRAVASTIVENIDTKGTYIKRVEVAGPGFINFFLDNKAWLLEALSRALREGEQYGRTSYGRGRRVQVEFISANPTGPMVVVQARAGAVGDTLANLLDACGFSVEREFYINDAGNQVDLLGRSLEARYLQEFGIEAEIPEGGYPGEYLVEMARDLIREKGDALLPGRGGRGGRGDHRGPTVRSGYSGWGDDDSYVPESWRHRFFARYAVEKIVESHKKVLADYGVHFDVWFSEKSLHDAGAVEETIEALRERGYVYENEGALWLRSTAFGDDKDRVLKKQDGEYTYLAPDIAYHRNKFERGFETVIDIWGPDHHGYIARMKAAIQALGYPENALEVLIVQLVRLIRGGEAVRMSKRAGEFVTMSDLLTEVGKDAARFFFLMRAPESHLDFDIDLAKLQTQENPVFYVQYASARIASIFRQAAEEGIPKPSLEGARLDLLGEESELLLMRKIADLPEEILGAALAREPHRMTKYATELASAFHVFYTQCRVLGNDPELTAARLLLVEGAGIALRNTLRLLGVSAPERM
ncbi:MAG TPA: arginine--tRNA ligase [Clostridia bacterium]|nr:arginine--tRNA ligase [Clostridia bacterium]